MNKESIAKVVKAAVILASIAGYNISPENVALIIEGAGVLMTAVYSFEAWWKKRAGGQ